MNCHACHNKVDKCDCFTNPMNNKFKASKPTREYGISYEPKKGVNVHGPGGYTRGCRCNVCREAKKAYARKFREVYKARRDLEG